METLGLGAYKCLGMEIWVQILALFLSYDVTWLATQPFRSSASNLPCGRYLTSELRWDQSYSFIRSMSQLQFSFWRLVEGWGELARGQKVRRLRYWEGEDLLTHISEHLFFPKFASYVCSLLLLPVDPEGA